MSALPCPAPTRRHHLLIAGTGRAGTSFLVRYLNALGLDTALARHGERSGWSEEAHAGLENLPLPELDDDLPYVIKSPWAVEMIDDVLGHPQMQLDGVILPVRDIVEAASSRTVQELRAIHEQAPWMADLSHTWEAWGHTDGGALYSLHPLDQARLLAMGFHRLVHRLIEAEVPMHLLAFPRFVEDADYLYRRLRPLLPSQVTLAQARRVHAQLADPAKVRVGVELAALGEAPSFALGGPSLADLDRVALAREVARLRRGGGPRSRWSRRLARWAERLRAPWQRLRHRGRPRGTRSTDPPGLDRPA